MAMQVKRLMQDQREIDASYSELRVRTGSIPVLCCAVCRRDGDLEAAYSVQQMLHLMTPPVLLLLVVLYPQPHLPSLSHCCCCCGVMLRRSAPSALVCQTARRSRRCESSLAALRGGDYCRSGVHRRAL